MRLQCSTASETNLGKRHAEHCLHVHERVSMYKQGSQTVDTIGHQLPRSPHSRSVHGSHDHTIKHVRGGEQQLEIVSMLKNPLHKGLRSHHLDTLACFFGGGVLQLKSGCILGAHDTFTIAGVF